MTTTRPPRRRTLLGALLVLLALAPPAAAQAPKVERQVFDVSIAVEHVVDWTYNTMLERRECSSWTKAQGDQMLTVASERPTRIEITWVTLPGAKEPEVTWGILRDGRERSVVRSNGSFERNEAMRRECVPCGPQSEYGPCPAVMPTNASGSIACPTRRGPAIAGLRYVHHVADQPDLEGDLLATPGHTLLVEPRWAPPKFLARCLPGRLGQTLQLVQPLAQLVNVTALGRGRFDRGDQATYQDDRRQERFTNAAGSEDRARKCTHAGGIGVTECATTELRTTIRRVR